MPFFIPERLIRFEYFTNGRANGSVEKDEEAKPYQDDMDFAFFAVNFGYSKADYNSLTLKERAFILKAYETKVVNESTLLRDAVFNAISNAFRKKGKAFRKLWRKASKVMSDEEFGENLKTVLEAEKKEKNWVSELMRRDKNG